MYIFLLLWIYTFQPLIFQSADNNRCITIKTKIYGNTAAKQSVWGTAIGIMQLGAMIGAGISPFLMRRTSRK